MTKKFFLISLLAILIVALINTTVVHATEIDGEEVDTEIDENYSLIQSKDTVSAETEEISNKVKTTGAIEEGITDGTGTLPQTGKVADIIVNSLYVLIIGCSICLVVVLISSVKER